MIDKESISNKFDSLNNEINSIKNTCGEKIANQLLDRVEVVLIQFLDDFKKESLISFSIYWDKQKKIEGRFKNKKIIESNTEIEKDKIIPKFISEYKK